MSLELILAHQPEVESVGHLVHQKMIALPLTVIPGDAAGSNLAGFVPPTHDFLL
jgi:hypothetical protein